MKSEEKLLHSYEQQRLTFEAKRKQKVHNIDLEIEKLEVKIEKLRSQSEKLKRDKYKVDKEVFMTFNEYKDIARKKSQTDRGNSNSQPSEYSNPGYATNTSIEELAETALFSDEEEELF